MSVINAIAGTKSLLGAGKNLRRLDPVADVGLPDRVLLKLSVASDFEVIGCSDSSFMVFSLSSILLTGWQLEFS